MTVLALLSGLLLLALVLQDAFEVMLLPRRIVRRWRLMRAYFRVTWTGWATLARTLPEGARRERFLSIYGALSMMVLFALWDAGLILAFSLIQWGVQSVSGFSPTFGQQAYLSGVTFFTLGYGDVLPQGGLARAIAVIEAGVGFGVIAVVIGYLPVLYQLFSRREAHVIQLDARAGSPPTSSGMLRRHAESDGLHKLDELLRAWEIWGADLLESHLSYPMLAYYRSQHDDQSWLAALTAIMDTCALILVGVEDVKPLQARMTFAMARQVVVELVRSLDLPALRPNQSERLPPADYARMIEGFIEAGLNWNGGAQGEEVLAAVRATYEPPIQALADYLLISLPGWLPSDDSPDHWERGPRGIIARRLVQGLSAGSLQSTTPSHKPSRWSLPARRRATPRKSPPPRSPGQ
jgi:hypothetical protein